MLLCSGGISLLAGCWDAGFLSYDDSVHISANKTVLNGSFSELLTSHDPAYFPMTLLSYRLDLLLFSGWLPQVVGSWAPGVRFMTCVYHILAAIILWRIMLRLGLSRLYAFIVAMAFVSHPLACETVCWISERKNALAALFGFGAIYSSLRFEGRIWRTPVIITMYLFAVLSKAGGLGIFPVLVLVELFGGQSGLRGERGTNWRPSHAWIDSLKLIVPLIIISVIFIVVNVNLHGQMLVSPPGGSIFTALLTDFEIVSRYLFNIAAPIRLSAVYFIMPVLSVFDPRVWLYGPLLALLVGGSILFVQQNSIEGVNPVGPLAGSGRRLVIFGWLWFFGALLPNLNFVAFTYWMQDRYVYLSTPGILLVAVQVVAELQRRYASRATRCLRLGVPVYLAALVALAVIRSTAWQTTYTLFTDAVEAQPLASYAHHELGRAYFQAWNAQKLNPKADPVITGQFHSEWLRHWRIEVEDCPDRWRFGMAYEAALVLAEKSIACDDLQNAERYARVAAYPPRDAFKWDTMRASGHNNLSVIRLMQKRYDEALLEADAAVQSSDEPSFRLARALTATEIVRELSQKQGTAEDVARLGLQVRRDLESIPPGSDKYLQAQTLLRTLH